MNNLNDSNVILSHQKIEADYIRDNHSGLIKLVLDARSDIVEAIAVDILLKKIRRISCKETLQDCLNCWEETCISLENIDSVIKNNKTELYNSIKEYENNSFSIPWRWMVFQDIIDEHFSNDVSLAFFEVWCSWGSLWKVLTNSNYARKYFQHKEELNNTRETAYYWIDPFLPEDVSAMIANIAGSSLEAQKYRKEIIKFEGDPNFLTDNIRLWKKLLDKEQVDNIKQEVVDLVSSLKHEAKELVIITSMVRYHFNNQATDKAFFHMIKEILDYVHKNTGVSVHYISRELYDDDGQLYPSKWAKPTQTKVFMHSILNWTALITKELTKFNYVFKS